VCLLCCRYTLALLLVAGSCSYCCCCCCCLMRGVRRPSCEVEKTDGKRRRDVSIKMRRFGEWWRSAP
jgi:hypothetical protein